MGAASSSSRTAVVDVEEEVAIEIGPLRVVTRLTTMVECTTPHQVDVKVLQMNPGTVNRKTGEITFNPKMALDSKVTNRVTWRDSGVRGLQMIVYSRNVIMLSLPWWFPMPTIVVQQIVGLFVDQVVKLTIRKVAADIESEFEAWT